MLQKFTSSIYNDKLTNITVERAINKIYRRLGEKRVNGMLWFLRRIFYFSGYPHSSFQQDRTALQQAIKAITRNVCNKLHFETLIETGPPRLTILKILYHALIK